jgi:hypothetical protein
VITTVETHGTSLPNSSGFIPAFEDERLAIALR